LLPSSVAKNSAAPGFASSASCRSSGTVIVRAPWYARSQRPSAFACSTAASPDGFIAPASISAAALSRLILDQRLVAVRGVNRCSQKRSSSARFWPSIQPYTSPSSIDSS
jgi:hypothetical protein